MFKHELKLFLQFQDYTCALHKRKDAPSWKNVYLQQIYQFLQLFILRLGKNMQRTISQFYLLLQCRKREFH